MATAYVGGSPQPAFSYAQLEALWIQAARNVGGTNVGAAIAAAPMAAAVAMAESSLIPNAWNTSDPNGGSFGLFQVNGAHAQSAASAGLTNWQTDPLQNAEAAVMVWNAAGGSFFQDWSTAANGSYLPYLADASGAAGSAGVSTSITRPSPAVSTSVAPSSSGSSVFTPTALSGQAMALIIIGAAIILLVALAGALRGAQPSANEAST